MKKLDIKVLHFYNLTRSTISMFRVLTDILIILTKILKTVFKSKKDLIIENLVLRQKLSTYKAKKIKPTIKERDRAFWIALKKSWPK